jgi:hypothetical protein
MHQSVCHATVLGDPTCPPPPHEKLFCSMNRGDHADEEVETDAIAFLKAGREDFCPDAGNPHLAVGLVGEPVVHVVRQLAMNADWLNPMKNRLTTAF